MTNSIAGNDLTGNFKVINPDGSRRLKRGIHGSEGVRSTD